MRLQRHVQPGAKCHIFNLYMTVVYQKVLNVKKYQIQLDKICYILIIVKKSTGLPKQLFFKQV